MNEDQVVDTAVAVAVAGAVAGADIIVKAVEMKFKGPMKKAVEAAVKAGQPEPKARPAFTVNLPQYTWEGLTNSFTADSKVRDLLLYLVNTQIVTVARDQVMDEENPVNSDSELDKSKLTLESIATLTAEQLAGKVEITKEELQALADAMEKYLPALGYPTEAAKLMGAACKSKFANWKAKPEVLKKLQGVLFQFAESTSAEVIAPLAETLDYLNNLMERYINKPETDKLSELLLG